MFSRYPTINDGFIAVAIFSMVEASYPADPEWASQGLALSSSWLTKATKLATFLRWLVNTQQLRKSIKQRWLTYYVENRQWITRLRIWVDCDGQRRPSSSFILATLSILEPQLNQLLPLIVDLSSNPDRIVMALGLNFNPDEHPYVIERMKQLVDDIDSMAVAPTEPSNGNVKLLPAAPHDVPLAPMPAPQSIPLSTDPASLDIPLASANTASLLSKMDEGCTGGRYRGRPDDQG